MGEPSISLPDRVDSSSEVDIVGFKERLPGPRSTHWYLKQHQLQSINLEEHHIRLETKFNLD